METVVGPVHFTQYSKNVNSKTKLKEWCKDHFECKKNNEDKKKRGIFKTKSSTLELIQRVEHKKT